MIVINEFSTVFNINYTIYLIEDISNLFFYFTLSLNYNSDKEGYLQQQIDQLHISFVQNKENNLIGLLIWLCPIFGYSLKLPFKYAYYLRVAKVFLKILAYCETEEWMQHFYNIKIFLYKLHRHRNMSHPQK